MFWRPALFAFLLIFSPAFILSGEPASNDTHIDPRIIDGLIRWWPNLFDARDEITGQEGVVMGLLPPVETGAEDETEFGRRTGWVKLQPAITNEVFTFSFWVICRRDRPQIFARLLAQETTETEWIFQTDRGDYNFFIGGDHFTETDASEHVRLGAEVWRHVAIARKAGGTSIVWVDGTRALEGGISRAWPGKSRWLVVGNGLRGGGDFHGGLRDLCAFDRVLRDDEVREIHERGLPRRPARNTAARLAATLKPITSTIYTNVDVLPARNWLHQRFTTEDGLPGNIVKAVLQAQNGFLWVGTEEGLARFDGRRFREFTAANTPALAAIGQTVFSLAEDAEGSIWAGTFGGLVRIRDLEFTAFTNGLPQRFVLQVESAGDGWLWVAGFNAFVPRGPCWLRRFHPESGISSAEVAVPGHLRRLVMTDNGVWLATQQPQQIHFWDGRSPATRLAGLVDDEGPVVRLGGSALPPDASIRSWTAVGDGADWWTEIRLGTGGPAFHWLWSRKLYRPWAARWAGPVNSEEAWLGVAYGLARLRDDRLQKVEISDDSVAPEIACLSANREGGVWFGTEEDGLHLLRERPVQVFTIREGLSGNDVRSVSATPEGGLWVATAEGLSQWRSGGWTSHERGRMRAIISGPDGLLWIGLPESGPNALRSFRSGHGASIVDLGLDWKHPNCLRFSRDGTLWVVCERGLTWIKTDRLIPGPDGHWTPDPKSAEPVFGRYEVGKELPKIWPLGLIEDHDGSMWIGSQGHGLFQVTDGQVRNFTDADSLPSNVCAPVYQDPFGALWILSEAGLTRRQNGRFESITRKHGLPKDTLLDLVEDDRGGFWISGKRGIHRVERKDLEDFFAGRVERVQTLTLGQREGLLTPECSSFNYPSMARTPDGHIWVATRNGLATFDPRRVALDTRPLPALIEHLVVNRREFPVPQNAAAFSAAKSAQGESVLLPPGSGQQLVFHYTAISLAGADRIKFRHRLIGYDSEWSPETELRLSFYTNLRPGAYRFEVKAANSHGIWSEDATPLDFVILPFFWQTTFFYISSAVLLLAAAGGLHWHRLTVLRRFHQLKNDQALMSEKARIAADMHDELGARLTQIAILGEVAKSRAGDEIQTRSTLGRISQAAREVTARMSDLVWATNPRNDTLDNLSAYLREQAASQLEDTTIQPRMHFPAALPDCHVSATFRRNLLLVQNEALHNAVKHSGATEVSVHLEASPRSILLRIQDNGRGFAPSKGRGSGNGLGNMEQRVRDLGGEWRLSSGPGQGTCIEIQVPLMKADL
jgi:signal transduction histidine kinase/ligand-binding sensor domain-containing protein